MTISLSKRLTALVDMMPEVTTLYDIGCDHGFTSITALQRKKCSRAFACDVRTGPLQAASRHVAEAGLQNSVQTVLSDGLKEIEQVSAGSCVLISGMGGELMSSILKEALAAERFLSDTVFILQPQSELGDFRRFLYDNEMLIIDEDMVFEEGKYYPMMKACFYHRPQKDKKEGLYDECLLNVDQSPECLENNDNLAHNPCLTDEEYEFGPILCRQKHPVLLDYLNWKRKIETEILHNLKSQTPTERIQMKIKEVEGELAMIESIFLL